MTTALITTARCLHAGCDWSAEGDKADPRAESHTKQERHPTVTTTVPLLRVPRDGRP